MKRKTFRMGHVRYNEETDFLIVTSLPLLSSCYSIDMLSLPGEIWVGKWG
jgi:hypothetical protein